MSISNLCSAMTAPVMGILGAVLVTRWSWSLLRDTGSLLLRHQAPRPIQRAVREAIESAADNRLYDQHVWSVAPGAYAAIPGVVTHTLRPPEHCKGLIPAGLGIAHVTVEVLECEDVPALHRRVA